MVRRLNRLVIDDFLPWDLHGRLLDLALSRADAFVPTQLNRQGEEVYDADMRLSTQTDDGLGALHAEFEAAVVAAEARIVADLKIPAFVVRKRELELVAHGDGGYFRPHIDTFFGQGKSAKGRNRVVSAVYYFHRQPRGFSGGELAMLPIGPGEPELIEPRDNRLVAFPSFAPHEVRRLSVPSGDFADSRFSVNCWLRRAGPGDLPAAETPDQ